jgi:L-lactate utilization protein LutC
VLASGDQLSVSPLDRVDRVITGCAVALAEIGTLILDGSSREGCRVLTLVPLLAVTQTRFVNVEVSVSFVTVEERAFSGAVRDVWWP